MCLYILVLVLVLIFFVSFSKKWYAHLLNFTYQKNIMMTGLQKSYFLH